MVRETLYINNEAGWLSPSGPYAANYQLYAISF
jgi:hypothetical protein